MTNPNLLGSGNVAPLGDHFDQYGNSLGTQQIVLSFINGCLATTAVTQTTITDGAGAIAFASDAPTVTVS